MKKIIIILAILILDRGCKIYLINLQLNGTDVDFYIFEFLNFYLTWNTGIGFGLASLESNIYYHILTFIILIINFVLVYLLFKTKGIQGYIKVVIPRDRQTKKNRNFALLNFSLVEVVTIVSSAL